MYSFWMWSFRTHVVKPGLKGLRFLRYRQWTTLLTVVTSRVRGLKDFGNNWDISKCDYENKCATGRHGRVFRVGMSVMIEWIDEVQSHVKESIQTRLKAEGTEYHENFCRGLLKLFKFLTVGLKLRKCIVMSVIPGLLHKLRTVF